MSKSHNVIVCHLLFTKHHSVLSLLCIINYIVLGIKHILYTFGIIDIY